MTHAINRWLEGNNKKYLGDPSLRIPRETKRRHRRLLDLDNSIDVAGANTTDVHTTNRNQHQPRHLYQSAVLVYFFRFYQHSNMFIFT